MRIIYLLIIILLTFSCTKKKITVYDFKNKLKGNTFSLTSSIDKETVILELKDTTGLFLYDHSEFKWDLVKFEDSFILNFVFSGRESNIGIKQINDSTFLCKQLKANAEEITFTIKKPQWKKSDIYGKWIEEKDYSLIKDSIPPPPLPLHLYESDFKWPPYYEINSDHISNIYLSRHKSKIKINNTNEFLTLKLSDNYGNSESFWFIKELNDSVMIVDKKIKKESSSMWVENIKYIKKRLLTSPI
ncbi:hypothetical protein OAX11_04750, partial [Flavobacteriaceae bacterium]|nr:hypothetical protein [Flavobacteriaceae bacterium]